MDHRVRRGGQAQDPELQALAGVASAANKVPMFTGSGAATVVDVSNWRLSMPIQTGQYMPPGGFGGMVLTGAAPGANSMRMFLGYIRRDVTLTGFAVRVATVSADAELALDREDVFRRERLLSFQPFPNRLL